MNPSSLQGAHRDAILDRMLGRISDADLLDALGTPREGAATFGLEWLREAVRKKDADAVELGLYVGFRFGWKHDHVELLVGLAGEEWHHSHEDVVTILANREDPALVDLFYRTALRRFAYLDYDEAYALGVKCIYALARIPIREAIERLGDLARSGNPVLEAEAVGRLNSLATAAKSAELRELAMKVRP